MEEFQIKYFAERLKKIAKSDFGGVGKLAEAMGLNNLSPYTKQKGPIEPRASMLFRFAKVGIDINKLLTGESYMNEGIQKQIDELKELLSKQEEKHTNEINAVNTKLLNLTTELREKEKYIYKLESDKETLLSQVSSLNKAVHAPKTNVIK